jgi:[protein-PII] uridylyltransferase
VSQTPLNFKQRKQALLQACAQQQSLRHASRVRKHLRQLSQLCDDSLLQLWRLAAMPDQACLVAVGGYGRQALFPYSDVDVLVLLPDGLSPHDEPSLQSAIERFIGSCWDAGLEIGSSVRNLQECIQEAAGDITVQTSMLEARRLGGDDALFQAFSQGFHQHLDPRAFFTGKTLEMQQRHTKFANSPYSLEPNCKESPGGLRDLQMLLWLA